jgi:iron complex transport system substrate-binding protein
MVDIDVITGDALDLAIRIHKALGPGMLESVYEQVLAGKLAEKGYLVERQQPLDIEFEGFLIPAAFRIDIVVEQRLLIEIKSIERLAPVHSKQLLTYLRLTKKPVGLLINFGGSTLVEGYRRLVNDYKPSAISAPSARTQ